MPNKSMSDGSKIPHNKNSSLAEESISHSVMPDWLPQKFWDSAAGEVRLKELVKSYKALEKRLSSFSRKPLSEDAASESVADDSVDKMMDNSGDNPVEKLLKADSQDVDIAVKDIAVESQKPLSDDDLIAEFGNLERWHRVRPQLTAWAKHNLDEGMYDLLSTNIDGIRHMYKQMLQSSSAKEPQLVQGGDVPQALSEDRLRRMMQDPRYWRDRDAEFINRVMAGFRQLYDN